MTRRPCGLLAATLFLVGACSGQGTNRFDVSGAVTFNGQPVPAGQVVFSPDLSKGNDGPQGYAEIHHGRYDTRAMAKGAPSGPVVVRIEGFDGQVRPEWPYGKPLFLNYQVKVELPRQTSQKDFDVPASAGSTAKSALSPVP